MTIRIEKASKSNYEEIIAFANEVFGFENEQGQFQNLLPKLYQGNPQLAENHFLLRNNGKLEGLVLCQPDILQVQETAIPFYKIGTVSVSSNARGQGHMASMMRYANDFMKVNGAAFGVLGGLRHRYERFGFHPASCFFEATFTSATLRKKENRLSRELYLSNLEENSAWASKALALHNQQLVHCQRNEKEFIPILKSWQCIPLAISNQTEFLGYCCISPKENVVNIQELLLKDPMNALDVMKILYQQYPDKDIAIRFDLSSTLADVFLMNCDEYILLPTSSFHVLDFADLLKPLLAVARVEKNMPHVKMGFIIESEPLYLEICEKDVFVSHEIPTSVTPIPLSKAQATQIFFGPLGLAPLQQNIPAGIFPLPLFVPSQDCC